MKSMRRATPSDLSALIELGEEFYNASGYESYLPLDKAHTAKSLRKMIHSPQASVLVYETSLGILGSVGLATMPSYFSKNIIAIEQFIWVQPQARGKMLELLIPALEDEARRLNCTVLTLIALENLRPKAVGRLYENKGYVRMENAYIKRL
jgi:hypothetical protein